jgi:hypothetical protein
MTRALRLAAATIGVLGLSVADASAATRYAAPGGTGPDPCASSASPCSIYTAAGVTAPGTTVQAGDEVVLAPGEYSDAAGDLGPSEYVQLQEGIELHGEPGKPRPEIVLENNISLPGAFIVVPGDVVSHVEITTSVARTNIEVSDGIVEDLIARNTSNASQSITCVQVAGTIRNSACLASADFSAAVGENNLTAANSTATLRNVTAIDTGTSSKGLSYTIFGSGGVTVSAKAVIAKGDVTDVAAEGLGFPLHTPGTGGEVTINLDHSDFSSTAATSDAPAGGTASITAPTEANNVQGAPLLAADGYHQLVGSPTIDTGATDGSSAATDIDGQNRTIDAPDIGADEYAHPTSLTLSCTPAKVILTDALPGGGTTCTAAVTDEAEDALAFSGEVSFSSSGDGSFEAKNSCTLPVSPEPTVSCQVNYLPRVGSGGSHTITATFAGDGNHEGGEGATSVAVEEAIACPATATFASGSGSPCGPGVPNVRPRPRAKITKKPLKKSAKRLAQFSFTSDQREAAFECKLDKKPFKPCRSPFKHRVKPGHHNFAVRAVSRGGASKPATYGWTVKRAPR